MPFSFLTELKQSWMWLLLALGLVILLVLLGPVLTPFIAAAILAYALNPGVDWLASHRIGRFGVPRAIGVIVMMLLLFAAVLALVLIVVPVLQKEISLLQDKIPPLLSLLDATFGPKLSKLGIQVHLDSAGIEKFLTQKFSTNSSELWSTIFASAKIGGLALIGWLVTIALIPIALFYLLLDWHRLLTLLGSFIPRRWIQKSVGLANEVDNLLAQYLRGQLLVMLILAVYYSVALAVLGFDVALPVGIITGLLVFIPYLGFGLGLVLALVASVLQFDGVNGLIGVACVYGAGQIIEGFFLTPRLVGERIGLHPLMVIFGLLAFAQLFGFVGVLLALPACAILSVAFKHLRSHYLNSSFYNQQSKT
ncbi:MAG: AI-2E family transporter [Burkholderiaceae bacterium]